jgi:hypothetical protein
MIWRSFLVLVAMALGLSFSSRPAYADSETISGCSNCNGYSFTANITSNGNGTYRVLYTITNNNGAAANPYSWSLTSFSNGNTVTSATTPTVTLYNGDGTTAGVYSADYKVNLGKSNNGNGNCTGSISDAFCVQETSTTGGPLLQQGQSLTFAFDVTCSGCSLMSSWDFMGSGNPASGTGNVYAITNWGTSTSMPEPSVGLLYASTVAAGLVFAWRSRPQRPSTKL